MIDYNDMRTINGAQSLIAGIIILYIGVTLLWRGYAERAQWVRQMPGRMVIGSFLTLTALIAIEAAVVKLLFHRLPAGGVGQYINTWYINLALAVSILLGIWSMVRLWGNTLGPHQDSPDRIAEATERLAAATEVIADHATKNGDPHHDNRRAH